MTTVQNAKEDLQYVSAALRRSTLREPATLYFLWAVLVGVGFALPDHAPRYAGWYWLFAAPLGGLASMWIGHRSALARGQVDRRLGMRYGGHWGLFGLGFLLAALPPLTGRVDWSTAAAYYLLLAGLAYALAGLHLNRPMLWSGLIMLAGFAVLMLAPIPYVWTATALIVALALAMAGWQTARQH